MPENSPIVPGEMFSPEAGAQGVRRAKSTDRKAKLQEFKEKYVFQKEGLGKLQEKLTVEIINNPDITREELIGIIKKEGELLGLTGGQKRKLRIAVDGYIAKHINIKEVRKLYADDQILFKRIFEFEPRGKVEILQTPVMLYFRLFDPKDYARLFSGAFLEGRDATEEELERANKADACLLKKLNIPGLAGSIGAENSKKIGSITREEVASAIEKLLPTTATLSENDGQKKMLNVLPSQQDKDKQVGLIVKIRTDMVHNNLVHEESHAIKNIFDGNTKNEEIFYSPVKGESDEMVEIPIRRYLRQRRQLGEEFAKDELIAYLKHGGTAPRLVFEMLSKPKEKGGLYDYFAETKKDVKSVLYSALEDMEYFPLVDKNIGKVFEDEYLRLLENGIDAFLHLKEAGYAPDKVAALLITEPLSKWKKAAERLTGKKIMPRHLPFRLFGDVEFEVVPPDDESSPS